ncbi:MAG TPA: L,D-transpeptidase, partial [Chloroflexota bacterium]|nr:L,D-transpeptidase [Chloroflexota bacterium]
NPKTKNYAFVEAEAVGPTAAPKAAAIEVQHWQGQVSGDVVNLRAEPHTFIAPAGQVRSGDLVTVSAWLEGEALDPENRTWGRVQSVKRRNTAGELIDVPLGEPAGPRFIYSGLLRPLTFAAPPAPPKTSLGDGGARWIDVNLSQQIVTAYEGTRAVYFAPTTSGRPGWETPTGIFRIQRRVENETMVGSTLLRLDTMEIPDYRLENVKWTQYFTSGGPRCTPTTGDRHTSSACRAATAAWA